jgi:calcineurin-like phosphoesterase family protein
MTAPRVFYWSDLHLGHRKVAAIRGFGEGEEAVRRHDLFIFDAWCRTVTDRDLVYVLGDIAVSGFHTHALPILAGLPGRKRLIAGNHDPVHPQHRRTFARELPRWLEVFETVSPFERRRLNGHTVLLSHYPYEEWGEGPERGGREAARDLQYRLPDLGTPLLHGHTHGRERGHGHEFHVGVDAWRDGPVAQELVIEWLDLVAAGERIAA